MIVQHNGKSITHQQRRGSQFHFKWIIKSVENRLQSAGLRLPWK